MGLKGSLVMPKIVYVPQGYAAKYVKSTAALDIQGLYADGFSSCNIIAYISNNTLLLAHIDFQTLPNLQKIKESIQSLANPNGELVLIFRNDTGEHLKDPISEYFKNTMPHQMVTKIELADEKRDGIYISFNADSENQLHPNIKIFPSGERPNGLIHHPEERQFLSVQKIEQMVGLRARVTTGRSREKKLFIFDGVAWEHLTDAELKVDESHALTREEMEKFRAESTHVLIAGRLAGLVTHINEMPNIPVSILGELKDNTLPVSPYIEDYVHNYNHELCLKINLKNILSNQYTNSLSCSESDRKFKEAFKKLLNKSRNLFIETVQLIDSYTQEPSDSEFKTQFLDEYRTISRHYRERKYYDDLTKRYLAARNNALEAMTPVATKSFQDKDYQKARMLFAQVVQDLTSVCFRDDPCLATAYYNYGRSLFFLERYQASEDALTTCLALRTISAPNLVEKTQKALQECRNKLLITPAYSSGGGAAEDTAPFIERDRVGHPMHP